MTALAFILGFLAGMGFMYWIVKVQSNYRNWEGQMAALQEVRQLEEMWRRSR